MMEVHYFSMIIISVGSSIFGILPMAFTFRVSGSPFFLSLILCLGGGVLLSTSLIHMLTDVQEKLKFSAQLYFCAGFLTLYMFDEISHYCLSRKKTVNSILVECDTNQIRKNDYGATDPHEVSENLPFLQSVQGNSVTGSSETHYECRQSHFRYNEDNDRTDMPQSHLNTSSHSENNGQGVSHINPAEYWTSNSAARTGLLIALFIHSVLEGVSIGVQTKVSQILLILGAVSFHKIVLSFCLGLELLYQDFKTSHILGAIFLFSIGSPIGIFVGMTVTSPEVGIFSVDAQLQAVAAGSLLYVAAFEVLSRERLKWQHSKQYKAAGIFQMLFLLIGFSCITAFHFFVDHNGGRNETLNVTKSF